MKKQASSIDDLLDEIAARYPQVQKRQPGDVDADMLAERRGIGRQTAASILYKEWRAGNLDRALVKGARSPMYVYRRKGN